MADVVLFAPRREVDAKENVEAFIALCRNQLTAFGANLVFDDHVWNLSQDIKLKSSDKDINAVFSSMETAKTSKPEPMAQPFQDFAKAYFRYQHGLKPTSSIGSLLAPIQN